MTNTDIFAKIEGNIGKACNITLKNRAIIYNRILHGTKGNDYGDFFVVISEGKSERAISATNIAGIEILD